jgi:hypothetical protein
MDTARYPLALLRYRWLGRAILYAAAKRVLASVLVLSAVSVSDRRHATNAAFRFKYSYLSTHVASHPKNIITSRSGLSAVMARFCSVRGFHDP